MKDKKWIHSDPSVRLPYFMMKSDAWKSMPCSAQSLYCWMRMSMFDSDNGFTNTNEGKAAFGPSMAPKFSPGKYYRALGWLLSVGFIDEVSAGGHGRKAVYDMMTLRWMGS